MPILELSFESGEDSLSVRRFTVHEAVSSQFDVSIVARSPNEDIDLDTIVGKAAGFLLVSQTLAALGWTVLVARVWPSDCNDALERLTIQFGASMLIPYEVMGAHIGPERSHTTGRVHSMAFRALTALFGHMGVECDVRALSDGDRVRLGEAIELYRRFRGLIHTGDVVRFDSPVSAIRQYGVYSSDRREALIAHVALATSASAVPPPLRLPGLLAEARYRMEQVPLPGARAVWAGSGVVLTGGQLAAHGVLLPPLNPESGLLLHLVAEPG